MTPLVVTIKVLSARRKDEPLVVVTDAGDVAVPAIDTVADCYLTIRTNVYGLEANREHLAAPSR